MWQDEQWYQTWKMVLVKHHFIYEYCIERT